MEGGDSAESFADLRNPFPENDDPDFYDRTLIFKIKDNDADLIFIISDFDGPDFYDRTLVFKMNDFGTEQRSVR
jgi:hypothetical protein